jgi:hypothetical protein
MKSLAETDEGQFIFSILGHLGMSLNDWRSMDPRDKVFYMHSMSEKNRRVNNQQEAEMAKARARR